MKPENFSLKFQNSLADSRITPGSQHLAARSTSNASIPRGQRAVRRPTKAESRRSTGVKTKNKRGASNGRIEKKGSSSSDSGARIKTPLEVLVARKLQEEKEREERSREAEKERVVRREIEARLKGILKKPKLSSPEEKKDNDMLEDK
ncbi:hypothetical protein VTL71DRAFT_7069 [Oculimacula yallundae]|uniref:Uncharacterized protein n=1 Tax=Oculimacula yallundae TaxID=86028 RepID=A0ABR4BVS0_9HELO